MRSPVKLSLGGDKLPPIAEVEAALRARIDEDERLAYAAQLAIGPEGEVLHRHRDVQDHIVRHDPARVLAKVEAERALLDELDSYGGPETGDARDVVVRCLARPYGSGGET